jgi:hypothetical protein
LAAVVTRTALVLASIFCVLAACGGPSSGGATAGAGSGGTSGGSANANTGAASAGSTEGGTSSIGSFTTRNLEFRGDGSIAIGPGFLPTPLVLAGENGGPTEANPLGTAAGLYCYGYLPIAPQHVLEVTAPISHLRIVVDTYAASTAAGAYGSVDSTLFVRVPGGGIWCDDDGDGDLQPMVEGPVLPGRVEIFVGAYSAAGTGARYKLGVTESSTFTHADLR